MERDINIITIIFNLDGNFCHLFILKVLYNMNFLNQYMRIIDVLVYKSQGPYNTM